jgi:hypothetical protein
LPSLKTNKFNFALILRCQIESRMRLKSHVRFGERLF